MKAFRRILCTVLAAGMIISLTPAVYGSEFDYKQIIDAEYDNAFNFSNELAAVKKDGKWGYIDTDGNLVVSYQYDRAYSFNEGKAIVGTIEKKVSEYGYDAEYIKYGFIDRKGNYTPFKLSDGTDATVYYYVEEGQTDDYDDNLLFYNSIALLYDIEKYESKAFDKSGKEYEINIPNAKLLYHPTEGILTVTDNETEFAQYYRVNGNRLFTDKYFTDARPFNQGLALVAYWDSTIGAYMGWSFMDTNGNIKIKGPFDNFYLTGVYTSYKVFNDNGLASVQNMDGKWGAIDKTGKTVIPFKYDTLNTFVEGVAAFKENGKYGYIDIDGNVVIEPQYDQVSMFNNGVAVVRNKETAYCIDKTGSKIDGADKLPSDSYFIEEGINDDGSIDYTIFSPGKYVTIKENDKYGFGEIEFTPSMPAKEEMAGWAYDEVVKAIENNLVPANLQNMYRTDTTRVDFAALVVCAIEEITGSEIPDVLEEKTGKDIYELVANNPFKDTTDSDVIAAQALGIINGVGNNNFAPENTITRQDAAALLMRTAQFLGQKTNDNATTFADDASIASYAKQAVNFVSSLNIMNGTGNNNFSPKQTYTRQQAYVTIYRLFESLNDK